MASSAATKAANEVSAILRAIHLGHITIGGPEHAKRVHRIAALAAKYPEMSITNADTGITLPMSMIAPGVLQHYLQAQKKKPEKVLELEYKPHVSHPLPASSPFSFQSQAAKVVRKAVKRKMKADVTARKRSARQAASTRKKEERQEVVQAARQSAPYVVQQKPVRMVAPIPRTPLLSSSTSYTPLALTAIKKAEAPRQQFLTKRMPHFGFNLGGESVSKIRLVPAVAAVVPAVTGATASKKRVRVDAPEQDMSFMAVLKRCVAQLKRENRKKAKRESKTASKKVVSKAKKGGSKKAAKKASAKKKPKAMSVSKKIAKPKKKASKKKEASKKTKKQNKGDVFAMTITPKKASSKPSKMMKTRSCK